MHPFLNSFRYLYHLLPQVPSSLPIPPQPSSISAPIPQTLPPSFPFLLCFFNLYYLDPYCACSSRRKTFHFELQLMHFFLSNLPYSHFDILGRVLGCSPSVLDMLPFRKCLFFYSVRFSFLYAIRLYFSISISLESKPRILINCGKPECINMKERTGGKSHQYSREGEFELDLPLISVQNLSRSAGLAETSLEMCLICLFYLAHIYIHLLSIWYCSTEDKTVYRKALNIRATDYIWNTKDMPDYLCLP